MDSEEKRSPGRIPLRASSSCVGRCWIACSNLSYKHPLVINTNMKYDKLRFRINRLTCNCDFSSASFAACNLGATLSSVIWVWIEHQRSLRSMWESESGSPLRMFLSCSSLFSGRCAICFSSLSNVCSSSELCLRRGFGFGAVASDLGLVYVRHMRQMLFALITRGWRWRTHTRQSL